jgi:hypothetical protein
LLPSDATIQDAAGNIVREVNDVFLRVPFTVKHARAALDRVDSELPPNRGKQQFKDSAIWEATLQLAQTHHVHFITNDSAFYASPGRPDEAMASNLREECTARSVTVTIYRTLSSALKSLQKGISDKPVDPERVASEIEKQLDWTELAEVAGQHGLHLAGARASQSVAAYLTGKPQLLAIDFDLTYPLEHADESGTVDCLEPTLTAEGNCFYDVRTKEVASVHTAAYRFRYSTSRGEQGWWSSFVVPSGQVQPLPPALTRRSFRLY